MKKLWSAIKAIISHKSSTSSSINKTKDKDGNITSHPFEMSNVFNNKVEICKWQRYEAT